jgi:hypothetical protein
MTSKIHVCVSGAFSDSLEGVNSYNKEILFFLKAGFSVSSLPRDESYVSVHGLG